MLNFKGINRDLEQQELQSIVGQGTHLVVQSHDLMTERDFFDHCWDITKRHNLDSMVVVNSSQSNIFHPAVQTFWPDIVTLGDKDLEFLSQLQQQWQLTRTPHELIKLLRYQILFKDGEVVYYKHQPVQDHWHRLYNNKEAMKTMFNKWGTHYVKKFMGFRRYDQGSMWEREVTWGWSGPTAHGKQMAPAFIKWLMFYDLWHNKELEDTIKKVST